MLPLEEVTEPPVLSNTSVEPAVPIRPVMLTLPESVASRPLAEISTPALGSAVPEVTPEVPCKVKVPVPVALTCPPSIRTPWFKAA